MMSVRNPGAQTAFSEPKLYVRGARCDDDREPDSISAERNKAWLREQLLAGKNSPLCDPITPAYFQQLRALARGEL